MVNRRVASTLTCALLALGANPIARFSPVPAAPPPPYPRDAALEDAAAPAWSRDDSQIIYMTMAGAPGTLLIVPSTGGTPKRLFEDDRHYASPSWSRDGTRLAFSSDRSGPWLIWTSAPDGSDARSVTPNQLTRVFAPSWSPDGSQVAYAAVSRSGPVIMVVAAQGGTPKRLTAGWWPRWSPDGSRIAYTDRYDDSGVEHEAIAIYAIESGRSMRLRSTATDPRRQPLSCDWLPDGRIVTSRRRGSGSELLSVDVPSDTAAVIGRVDGFVYYPASSHRGDRVAYMSTGSDHAGEIHVVQIGAGRSSGTDARSGATPLALTRTPAGVPARYVEYESENGVRIPSWLYVPPGMTERGPALVWVHGGAPGEGSAEDEFDQALQYFVRQGYTVIAPNYRGSTGYGEAIARFPGLDAVVRDIVAAGDHLRTLPSVDPGRVGIIGFSGGGFWTAMTVAAQPSGFRAAADFFAATDLVRLHESPLQRPVLERLMGPLSGHEDEYRTASPISRVSRITVPMLVVHGDADQIVPVEQSIRFVEALRAAGKPVQFERLKGGHGFQGAEQAAAFEAAAAFFATQLHR